MDVDINDFLGYNINRVAILQRGNLIKCFREFKITPEQWIAMVVLSQNEAMSQVELGSLTLNEQKVDN